MEREILKLNTASPLERESLEKLNLLRQMENFLLCLPKTREGVGRLEWSRTEVAVSGALSSSRSASPNSGLSMGPTREAAIQVGPGVLCSLVW